MSGTRAQLVAQVELGPRAWTRRLPGVGWIVQAATREVIVLDEALAERARWLLPSGWHGAHWVTDDFAHVIMSDHDRVRALDRRGRSAWEARHPRWGGSNSERGSCWVEPGASRVWATVPSTGEESHDQCWVLDVASGRQLGVASLDCNAAGSHPVPHPDGRHVGLSVGEGQDGAHVYWGVWQDGAPSVESPAERNRVLTDVHPSGSRFLTTPHSDDRLLVHAFPGGEVVASLTGEDAFFGIEDGFDYAAGYVTEDLVLAGTRDGESHAILRADTLVLLGHVEYPEGAVREQILATGRGTWLTCDYVTGLHQLWRLNAH